MRAVLDTNVLVSAVLSGNSPPDAILRASLAGAFVLVTSPPLLKELESVLARPRITRRLGWSDEESAQFLADIRDSAIIVVPEQELRVFPDDPADDRAIEAAMQGQVDYIVSGDAKLIELGEYAGIQIVTPARFAAILATSAS